MAPLVLNEIMHKLPFSGCGFKFTTFKTIWSCFWAVKQSVSVKNDGMMKQSVHEKSCLKGLDVAWTWLGKGGIWSGKVCYRLFRRPNRMCVWSWHNAANVKCFLRGTVIAGGLYYSCARLTQKYRTFFLIAFSFLHRAGTITNSLERWWIGQRLVQWPLGGGSID